MDMAGDVKSTGETQWQTAYESQVAVRRAQIDRMIAFAESTQCRMATLVKHFGDASDKAKTCGLCDICNPSGSGGAQSAHPPTAQERTWLRDILFALEKRSTSTGKLFTDLAIVKDRNDFDTLLDALARAGLISLINDTFRSPEGKDITYKKAASTHEGRLTGDQAADDATLDTVWIRSSLSATPSSKRSSGSKSRTGTSTTRSSDAAAQALNPAAEALFQQLRDWRTEQARPTKTPAFMILSDSVLRAIATHAPQNLTSLHAVPGMGPTKVDRFGADLITICRGTTTQSTPSPELAATPFSRSLTTLSSRPKQDSPIVMRSGETRFSTPHAPTNSAPLKSSLTTSAVRQNKPTPPPAPLAELTPTQLTLETRLKDWRRDEAKQAGIPTFFILSDTLLRTIVQNSPQSLTDLSNLRGLPTEKISRFGQTLLTLCRS